MYKVEVITSDGPLYYENIKTIKYKDVLGETFEVSGDDMLTHMFPASYDLYLFAATESSLIRNNSYKQLSIAKID